MRRAHLPLLMVLVIALSIGWAPFGSAGLAARAAQGGACPMMAASAMSGHATGRHGHCGTTHACESGCQACQACTGLVPLATAVVPAVGVVPLSSMRPTYAGVALLSLSLAPEPPPPRVASSC